MAQVPIVNQPTVKDALVPYQNENVNLNGDMFGENINKSIEQTGKGFLYLQRGLVDFKEQIDKTKTIEITSELDKYEQSLLYDKDNGYFYQTGKNAMGKSSEIMKSYSDYADELIKKSGLIGYSSSIAKNVIENRKTSIFKSVNTHDYQQTNTWQNEVFTDKLNNVLNRALLNRNDDKVLQSNYKDGLTVLELQAQALKWDDETLKIKKSEYASNYHIQVLSGLLSDGNLNAKTYYDIHKNEIVSDRHSALLRSINDNENRYKARSIVNDMISRNLTLNDAYSEIDKINNIDLQNSVRSEYETKLREKDRLDTEQLAVQSQASLDKINEALQTNPEKAYLAIDPNLPVDVITKQMNYIEQFRKYGDVKTSHSAYLELMEKMTYDAENFKKLDLNNYIADLSSDDFKYFKKRQDEIGTMGFTVIQDDNEMILSAIDNLGWWKFGKPDETMFFNQADTLFREYELRHGKKIPESEMKNILDSLGYKDSKGVETYKRLAEGMKLHTDFAKKIMNDFTYYEKVHKVMPPPEIKRKIIDERIKDFNREQKQKIQDKVNAVYAKPHETKELTYYGDTYLPQLGKDFGIKFTVVDNGRYNPRAKSYTSHHNENGISRAIDVSMSEHSRQNKLRFFESELNNPLVEKIGTSDPYIITKYGNHPKIVDEREFDRKNGTNHINHAHVTLVKPGATTASQRNNIVKVGKYTTWE